MIQLYRIIYYSVIWSYLIVSSTNVLFDNDINLMYILIMWMLNEEKLFKKILSGEREKPDNF